MTRLEPTRDRALATRYASYDAAVVALNRATPYSVIERVETTEAYIIVVPNPVPVKFWSGPWYVREVAE